MLENEWQRAMGELPEDMIGEAADAYQAKRRRPIWVSVTSVAAAILIVVSMLFWPANDGFVSLSNGIVVYAYAFSGGGITDDSTAIILKEGVQVKDDVQWSVAHNYYFCGLPVKLSVDEQYFQGMEITFDVSMSRTGFFERYGYGCEKLYPSDAYLGSEFTVANDTIIYWSNEIMDENNQFCDLAIESCFYTDITIKADDKIVGFTVLAFEQVEEGSAAYTVRLVAQELYPKVDGEMQNVSKDYILRKISEVKIKH